MYPYQDPSLPAEKRAGDLLSRMSLEEKVGQMRAYLLYQAISTSDSWAGWQIYRAMNISERVKTIQTMDVDLPIQRGIGNFSFSPDLTAEAAALESDRIQSAAREHTRLGIPVMIHHEGLHGLLANGATVFPQAIALSCTWDPALVEEIAIAIGREARTRGVRQILSPTLNIARDPRAGRTEETYGEDPFLTSRLAVAYVHGIQSQGVVATPKHFAANFMGDGGRDSHPIAFSEQHLREIYFPAFEAAVREGGALSFMAAYNSLDGLPCSCNPWLLSDVLRSEWDFKGFVVSDYWSVEHLQTRHAVAATLGAAGQRALEAGLDVELPEVTGFGSEFLSRLSDGSIPLQVLDSSVRRIVEVKFRIGLFDEPFEDPQAAAQVNHCPEHRSLSLQAARQGIVLLKNTGVLPISTTIRSIAVIGPLANVPSLGGYTWDGVPCSQVVTPLEGLQKLAADIDIRYSQGCQLTQTIPGGIQAAVESAQGCELAVILVGNSKETEGEGRDRSNLALPGVQADLVRAVTAAGIPTVVVLINGSPVLVKDWLDPVSALVEAWYPGEAGGIAIAEVLLGKTNPSGKLTITFPRTIGQLPLYYNAKPSGRDQGYLDETGTAQFPFGFGMSYTSFDFRNLEITPLNDQQFRICLEVQNTGRMSGAEVVQLYVHDTLASLSRPVKELKGFQRIRLEPGEIRPVIFNLSASQLGFYNRRGEYIVEPGDFDIMLGSSSEDILLTGRLTLEG